MNKKSLTLRNLTEDEAVEIVYNWPLDDCPWGNCKHVVDNAVPRVVWVTNEGGYNSTAICLDCLLEQLTDKPVVCPGCHGAGEFGTEKRLETCVVCNGSGIAPDEYCYGCGRHRHIPGGGIWYKIGERVLCAECGKSYNKK